MSGHNAKGLHMPTLPGPDDGPLSKLTGDLRTAYDAYRAGPSNETWTTLSLMYIDQLNVLDAVQTLDPSFPDPFPLAAGDIAGDAVYQWPLLPAADLVLTAILAAIERVRQEHHG